MLENGIFCRIFSKLFSNDSFCDHICQAPKVTAVTVFFFLPFGSQLSLYGEEQSRYSSLFVFYK